MIRDGLDCNNYDSLSWLSLSIVQQRQTYGMSNWNCQKKR